MKKYPFFIRVCKGAIKTFRKNRVEGTIKSTPCVFLARHMNVKGVIRAFCDIPITVRPWALAVFTNYESAKRHFNDYTFSIRMKKSKLFRVIFSPFCAVTLSYALKKLNAIPVYRGKDGAKSITTIKQSVKALENGENLLIFPDVDYLDDTEKLSGEIYKGFALLDVAYFRHNGVHIPFVPININKNTKILDALYLKENATNLQKKEFFNNVISGIYQGKY